MKNRSSGGEGFKRLKHLKSGSAQTQLRLGLSLLGTGGGGVGAWSRQWVGEDLSRKTNVIKKRFHGNSGIIGKQKPQERMSTTVAGDGERRSRLLS